MAVIKINIDDNGTRLSLLKVADDCLHDYLITCRLMG